MLGLFAAVALAALALPAAAGEGPPPSKRIARIMARGDGASPETAYRVARVGDRYDIVRALGLEVRTEVIVVRGKPYDLVGAVDPKSGRSRDIWFDIGRYYPRF
jgi:hypothetical protein